MGFTRILNTDLTGKRVSELSDIPEMNTTELKERFDMVSKDVIIPKHNKLVDELEAETGADGIGASLPEGIEAEKKVGSILKAIGEKIKRLELSGTSYNRLVDLFKNVNSVSDSVSDNSQQLPTGKAIVAYVKKLGSGDMQSAIYDQNNDGIVDDSERLGGETPDRYQKVTDQTLQTKSKTVPGAINELNDRKVSVVNPMEATEAGQVADALKTKEAIEKVEENFFTAANVIGDAIAALGVEVPEETSLLEMAPIIENQLYKRVITETRTGSTQIAYNRSISYNTKVITFDSPTQGIPTVSVSSYDTDCRASVVGGSVTRSGFTLRIDPTDGWTNAGSAQATVIYTATYTRQ